ncbi:hypothetical protein [Cyanobium sp. ULC082]
MKTFPFWGLRRRSAPFGRCAAARRHGLRERCGAATSRWGRDPQVERQVGVC